MSTRADSEAERWRVPSPQVLRSIIDTVPYPIFTKDAELRYGMCNAAFEAYLGLTPEQVFGKTVFEVSPPDKAEIYHQADRELLRQGGSQTYEAKVRYHDGSDHDVIFYKGVYTDDAGQALGIVGFIYDVTDLKRAERERAALREQLRHAQRMESIGRLAGGVAHDLNNLLFPILGFADLLLGELQPDSTHHGWIRDIRSAAERMRDLVAQLLAFSRKQVLEVKPVDLRTVLTAFRTILARTIREDVHIEIDLPDSLGQVLADVGQLEHVLMNLTLNAQDAMPGGGAIRIAVGDVVVGGPGEPLHPDLTPGSYVALTVADGGTGMDPTTIEHLFEPFFTTKAVGKGTGLGLSTAYGIVKQHGGHVEVASEVGRGTTFTIYLPRVEPLAVAAQAAPSSKAGTRGGTEAILVVEDDELVRRMACMMLERLGYHVLAAEGVEAALHWVHAEGPPLALVLTDVIMPTMNGRELFEVLRAKQPALRVVYMSGYDANVIARHGVLEQGVCFLRKPFTAEALAAKVRQALESS